MRQELAGGIQFILTLKWWKVITHPYSSISGSLEAHRTSLGRKKTCTSRWLSVEKDFVTQSVSPLFFFGTLQWPPRPLLLAPTVLLLFFFFTCFWTGCNIYWWAWWRRGCAVKAPIRPGLTTCPADHNWRFIWPQSHWRWMALQLPCLQTFTSMLVKPHFFEILICCQGTWIWSCLEPKWHGKWPWWLGWCEVWLLGSGVPQRYPCTSL